LAELRFTQDLRDGFCASSLPVTVRICGAAGSGEPGPWHSSDAWHGSGGGSIAKPPSSRAS
jgi:hypothetical protein